MSVSWRKVANKLRRQAEAEMPWHGVNIEDGQRSAILEIADRVSCNQQSLLLADEVGMGKTLIAATLADAVVKAGGRVAIVIPPGLGNQWQRELGRVDRHNSPLLPIRSVDTVLDAYREPHHEETNKRAENARHRNNARRQQKEWPQEGRTWRDEPLLLLSHSLGSFRWTDSRLTDVKKLLKQLAKVRMGTRKYAMTREDGFRRDLAERLRGDDPSGFYEKLELDGDARRQFQVLIGRALGKFDLVILDEAHKARGANSSISRILGTMLWKQERCFHLGITATPIELDNSQWLSTLKRLGLEDQPETIKAIEEATTSYDEALTALQRGALTDEAVVRFSSPAKRMANILQPWMLRRDLRDDPFLQKFAVVTDELNHRDRRAIPIPFGSMNLAWKRAFMASEALALRGGTDIALEERRHRLRMASGIEADPGEILSNRDDPATDAAASAWRTLAGAPLKRNGTSQYDHPLIAKAVELIEERTARDEKVLVFGRFNKPLRALTHLLDMRELVRRLSDPLRFEWPQRSLTKEQKLGFAAALVNAPHGSEVTETKDIDDYLARKYDERERRREALRHKAIALIDEWLCELGLPTDKDISKSIWHTLEAQVVAETAEEPTSLPRVLGRLFRELLNDCGEDDANETIGTVAPLDIRLREFLSETTVRTGHFASFLYGELKPQTRRNLQVAFNRVNAWPRVLVAQSKVASEGLDLQTACRTIVMIHPEWNPATCEQQIGRVDRLGSLWRRMASEYMDAQPRPNTPPPRIEILIPYVEGTYAEHNLRVLENRWDRLRGQLHGDIVTILVEERHDPEVVRIAAEIAEVAPRFSPKTFLKTA